MTQAKNIIISIATVAMLLVPRLAWAQNISVSSAKGDSIETFVNTYLAGSGVYLYNFKFNNQESTIQYDQIGTFNSNGYAGLQMDSGVVMTTGHVNVAPGPNNHDNESQPILNYVTDATMIPYSTNPSLFGCSTLDFDFVSISPYVSVNYCFASEEYPEFVCSSVNDVFAFLITGPNPATGITKTWNAAIIPYTVSPSKPNGIAVAINSVNRGASSNSGGEGCYWDYYDFYVANHKPNGGGPNNAQGVQYDGYTQKLSANATILPCTPYHMHISICNVGDNAYDSGVFLEYGSFNSPTADVNLSHRYIDTLERSSQITLPLTLDGSNYDVGHVSVSFGGTAVIEQDYTVTTDSGINLNTINTTFNLDKAPHSLTFKGTPTANLNEPKLIELYLKTALCDDYPDLRTYDTIRYLLVEDDLLRLYHDTIVAYDTCHQVGVEVAIGTPPFTFHWITEEGIDFPYQQYSTATITESKLYQVAAADAKGHTDTTDIYIDIRPKDGIDNVGNLIEARVYPNPSLGTLHIEADEIESIDLFTTQGQLLYHQKASPASSTLTVDHLTSGVYTLRINTARGFKTEKIIVKQPE